MGRSKWKKGKRKYKPVRQNNLEDKIKYTPEMMNDICPNTPYSRSPDCWDRFGNYESCIKYQNSKVLNSKIT